MTDEIRITRRIALPDKYEYYEIEWKGTSADESIPWLDWIETKVDLIRKLMEKPSPEISTETFTPGSAIIDDLHKAHLDPDIVEFIKPNIIKLKTFLKDKDKWNKYNGVFRDAGYKWIKDGKDSRWER